MLLLPSRRVPRGVLSTSMRSLSNPHRQKPVGRALLQIHGANKLPARPFRAGALPRLFHHQTPSEQPSGVGGVRWDCSLGTVCDYFKTTLRLFFSWEMSILSSRASQPRANPTSSPEPLSLFFSWATVCGPESLKILQTFPAVTPTCSLISTSYLLCIFGNCAVDFRAFLPSRNISYRETHPRPLRRRVFPLSLSAVNPAGTLRLTARSPFGTARRVRTCAEDTARFSQSSRKTAF